MAAHNDTGSKGEAVARDYLLAKGYRVRHMNWRCGHLELDIVAERDGVLVVVEVKTRSTDYYGPAHEAVTGRKRQRIVTAADAYVRQHDWQGETRFDIITLVPEGSTFRLEHIEDAFLA